MDYDPLNAPTRRARRALLAVSSAIILSKLYCVTVSGIPLGGFSLSFDPGLVDAALLIALLYLMTTFAIYMLTDWVNRTGTPRQDVATERFNRSLARHETRIRSEIRNECESAFDSTKKEQYVDAAMSVYHTYARIPEKQMDLEMTNKVLESMQVAADVRGRIAMRLQAVWSIVRAENRTSTAEAIKSSIYERARFFVLEGGVPTLLAILALLVIANPGGMVEAAGFGCSVEASAYVRPYL